MTSTISTRPGVFEASPVPAVRNLAAELHDGVVQDLCAARWAVEEVLASTDLPASSRAQLQRLSAHLNGSAESLRATLLHCSQPGVGPRPRASTADQVRAVVRAFEARHAVPATVTVTGSGPEPTPERSELLVRSAREALTNVAKHAGASRASVTLEPGPTWWTVRVEDDGSGDPAEVLHHARRPAALSFGLSSLAEQATRVAGTFTVDRSALGGIALRVTVSAGRFP